MENNLLMYYFFCLKVGKYIATIFSGTIENDAVVVLSLTKLIFLHHKLIGINVNTHFLLAETAVFSADSSNRIRKKAVLAFRQHRF